ncbi:hypothetical protein P879_08259 [Paragonimus westermani]|uniref:DNA ligase ATP-dependent N-terminal domain-containing protein n=1 Tax=Paragonimus westermani TaxID=34504 RepID=A0A8T0DF01_9TREM|nr:hypothetical protein P879_08259 [Paragonimus westermani]
MIISFRPFLRLRLGSSSVSLTVAASLPLVARELHVSKYPVTLVQQSPVVMSQKSIANSSVEKNDISVKRSPNKSKTRKRLIVKSDDSTDEPTNKENRVETPKAHCPLNDTSETVDIPERESSSPSPVKHKVNTKLASSPVSSKPASDSGSLRKAQVNGKTSVECSRKTKVVQGLDNSTSSGLSQEGVKYGVVTRIPSFSYDPSKANYHPINDATWSKSSSVPYLALAKTFEYIESTSGRLKITEALSNLFRSVGFLSPNDLSICVYLCLNQVGPAYQGNELGVGDTVLLKALGMTTGETQFFCNLTFSTIISIIRKLRCSVNLSSLWF